MGKRLYECWRILLFSGLVSAPTTLSRSMLYHRHLRLSLQVLDLSAVVSVAAAIAVAKTVVPEPRQVQKCPVDCITLINYHLLCRPPEGREEPPASTPTTRWRTLASTTSAPRECSRRGSGRGKIEMAISFTVPETPK